jgi:multidrug efflux pump subunit AcrA (membrane-fusion protein)
MSSDPLVQRLEQLRMQEAQAGAPAEGSPLRLRPWLRLALTIPVVMVVAWAVLHKTETAPAEGSAAPALTVSASSCAVNTASLVLSGYVRAARQAHVGAPTPGLVRRVFVKAGDRVTAGQPIAEVVNPPVQAQVEQARAMLAARQAALDELRNGPREEEVQQADMKVVALARDAERARLDRVRNQRLAELGLLPAQLRENAELNADIADAQLRAATAARDLLKRGPRIEQLRAAEAETALARAALRQADAQLAQTIVTAPFAGVVIRQSAEAGELVGVGEGAPTTLMIIADVSRLVVELDVPNASLWQVKPGGSVTVESDALPGQHLEGRVSWISPEADRHTLAVPIEIELPGGTGALIPGLAAKVTFPPPTPR